MQCDGFPEENYGLYPLGGLSDADAGEIREHLRLQCVTCEREIQAMRMLWASVASLTRPVQPRRAVRRRLLQSIGGRVGWWGVEPVRAVVFAGLVVCAIAVGWSVAPRGETVPAIAFSPAYTVTLPNASSVQPPPPAETVVKQVADPKQAEAIAVLREDLAREQAQRTSLESELARQRTIAANAEAAVRERTAPAPAATPTATPTAAPADDSPVRLAEATARVRELERQVSVYRTLLATQRQRLDRDLLLASLMSDPQLRVVKLRSTEKSRAAAGHALIAAGGRMAFFASDLPPLPSGRVYQLWLVRASGQAIASAGLFSPDEGKRGTVQLKDAGLVSGVTALAVTDEPAGGSVQPTGHKWLIGS